jgi:predicted AlkP superfamily phosphohydrolase/phosphomutase
MYLPAEVPDAVNNRKGKTLWELAGEAGYRTQVIRVPATFPAERVENGYLISGLGVPDMRGRVGTPSYYTSDSAFDPGDNEFSLELIRLSARRGRISTRIVGPYNKAFCDYVIERRLASVTDAGERSRERRRMERELRDRGVACRIDLPLSLAATDSTCTVSIPGMSRVLHAGEWSDWFVLDFPVNWVVDMFRPLRGIARFKLLALEPEVELYLSPINFHPDCHPVAFSWPPEHSEVIRKRFGLYKTLGWAIDTWSLPSGVGDETLFLEDMRFTVDKYEEIMEGLLGDGTDDLYIQIFFFTDRIGHLFWQFIDEGHPLYDPGKAARYGPEVLRAYQKMDAIVGKARRLAGEGAVLIVLSDHGFSSFRRGVNYNTWLVRNGFMTLKGQGEDPATLEKLFDTRELFLGVDWSRTKAYALGLGSIYINLAGREREGAVQPGPEYEQVCRDIRLGLEALVDPLTGAHPVTRVWTRDEMYTGYDPDLIPDLRAGNNLNYRVSCQTTLGGVPPDLIEDNLRAWSGDHCSSDPDLIPGILFLNRKLDNPRPHIMDIMPTVLDLMGIEVPPEVDGKSLL